MFVDCYDLEKIKNCFSALWATFSFYQNGGENIAVRPRMQFLQETLYKLPVLKMIFYWWKNKRKEKQLIFWWSGYVSIYQDGDEDHWFHIFETRPGGSTRDLANLGLEPGWVDEKIGKIMTRCDPADPAGWPGKIRLQPVDFCFFCFIIKTTSFWIFFKIGIDLADPATWSKLSDLVKTWNPKPEPEPDWI
jgi:hypothetical protein